MIHLFDSHSASPTIYKIYSLSSTGFVYQTQGNMSLLTTTAINLISTMTQQESETSIEDKETIIHLKFIVWGVMGGSLALLGFLGNILSMVVLQQRQMRSSTSYYLLSLAIYDNCVLLGMLFYFILPSLSVKSSAMKNYVIIHHKTIPIGYPLSLTAQMGSIYTCVGFTVERFIAVCRPLHVANTCTKSRALRAMLLIFIWSVTYNIPRFFHYDIAYSTVSSPGVVDTSYANTSSFTTQLPPYVYGCTKTISETVVHPAYNSTTSCALNITNSFPHDIKQDITVKISHKSTEDISSIASHLLVYPNTSFIPSSAITNVITSKLTPPPAQISGLKETEFGSNPVFQHIYLIYSYLCFMFLLPFIVILVMNVYLIGAVKKSRSMRYPLSTSASKEQNLTVMLIAVIVVFLVCQFPAIIDNILLAVMGQNQLNKIYSYQVFYIICTFMIEVNAAANFILYCFFGKKFRVVLLAVVGLKKRTKHVAYRSTVSKSRTNGTRSYEMEVSVM